MKPPELFTWSFPAKYDPEISGIKIYFQKIECHCDVMMILCSGDYIDDCYELILWYFEALYKGRQVAHANLKCIIQE